MAAGGGGHGSVGGAGGYGGGGGGSVYSAGGGGGGAGMGGAVFNEAGTVVITNSTFTGNTASGGTGGAGFHDNSGAAGQGLGGGLFNHNGTITVTNSTFSGNTAAQGGRGIFNLGDSVFTTSSSTTAAAIITNTIIGQADTIVQDFTGKTAGAGTNNTSGSGNLIRTASGFAGSVVSTADPVLGSLQNNGGPTQTMALLPDSPAIDAAAAGGPATDQRGFARVCGPVDIGAYEVRFAANMVVNTAADAAHRPDDSTLSLREAIDLANGTLLYRALSTAEKAQVTLVDGLVNTITFASSSERQRAHALDCGR